MLLGTYYYSVDEKGRIRMPVKLKAQLGDNFVVTKGSNGCLFVFSQDELKSSIYDKLKELPLTAADAQKPLRMIMSSAFEVQEDSVGRFTCPRFCESLLKLQKTSSSSGSGLVAKSGVRNAGMSTTTAK